MTIFRTTLIVLTLLIAACANHEGLYEPGCIAYAGDRIELKDGRFEWQRFTDQRVVDDDGNEVDLLPGFPKKGMYRLAAGRVEFVTYDDVRLDDWFVVELAGQRYLLTEKQHDAFLDSKKVPDCALQLTGTDS